VPRGDAAVLSRFPFALLARCEEGALTVSQEPQLYRIGLLREGSHP